MKYVLIALLLVGCAGQKTIPDSPKATFIPITVPCIKNQPTKPILMSKDALKALSAQDFVLQLTADYLSLESYTGELEALITACK